MQEVRPCRPRRSHRSAVHRLRFLRREPDPRRYGPRLHRVHRRRRGRKLRRGLPAGLAEGLFPRKVMEDPLLLDIYRECIGGLTNQTDRVRQERFCSIAAVAAASSRLSLLPARRSGPGALPRAVSLRLSRSCAPRLANSRAASFSKSSRRGRPIAPAIGPLARPPVRHRRRGIRPSSRSIAPQTLRRRPARAACATWSR